MGNQENIENFMPSKIEGENQEQAEALAVLTRWIDAARKYGLTDRLLQFWLLYDFAKSKASERYLRNHAKLALEYLALIDKSRPVNKTTCEYIESVIKKYL
jgi:hypothetical protein